MSEVNPRKFAIGLYEAFSQVLKRHRGLKQADKIIKIFNSYYYEQIGRVEIEVTSAEALAEETRHQIVNRLEKFFGNKIILREKVDLSLIGGLKLRYGDTVIDGSLKNRLELLRRKIS